MKTEKRLRTDLLKIATVMLLLPAFIYAGCSDEEELRVRKLYQIYYNSFEVNLTDLSTFPQATVTPPPMNGYYGFNVNGLSLEFRDDEISAAHGAVNAAGSNVSIEITATNNSGETFHRAWLVVHSPDNGVVIDYSTVDGYVGDGVYYYLGTFPDGAQKLVTVSFILPASNPDAFNFKFDVAEVHDRITFLSTTPSIPPEIFTMNPLGGNLHRVTFYNKSIIPLYPIWSPDGGWIANTAGFTEDSQIYLSRADGGGNMQLTCIDGFLYPGDFTRDGKGIYLKYESATTIESDIYLLNIDKAKADCSDKSALTPLTDKFPGTENLPVLSPQGDKVLYNRRVIIPMEQPVPPDLLCGGETWTQKFVEAYNVYYLPVDPVTGLPVASSEQVYLFNSLMGRGNISFSPDGSSIISNMGGCAQYQACCMSGCKCTNRDPITKACLAWGACCPGTLACTAGACPFCPGVQCPANINIWSYKCNLNIPNGIYTVDFIGNPPPPVDGYNYMVEPGASMYHFVEGTGQYEENPTWSFEYQNNVAFSKFTRADNRIQLWSLDISDPANTRLNLTNFDYFNINPRFMPPP